MEVAHIYIVTRYIYELSISCRRPGADKPTFIPAWDWRSTARSSKIYIEIFNWPHAAFHLDELPRTVSRAYLLADSTHKPLRLTRNGKGLDIALPPEPLDPIATVVVLETSE